MKILAKRFGRNIALLILIILFGLNSAPAKAEIKASALAFPALSPSEIISQINSYRSQNGLNTLQNNFILSQLAQGHAEYQASIGTVTHTGPGGTRPKDRAISAGYNGGNVTYFAEIIYGGYEATTSTAINWWKNSYEHNSMMLAPAFNEIGAGVATDGSWTYYTAEFGYGTGGEANPDNPDIGFGSNNPSTPYPPSIVYAVPVVTATPREDGAVIHVIRTGQVPWTLSFIYGIDLDVLLEQNGLTRYSFVFTGDEIIIVPSHTPTAIPPTPTITATVEITPTMESTATEEIVLPPSAEPTLIETEKTIPTEIPIDEPDLSNGENNYVKWIVMASVGFFLILIFISMYTPKRIKSPEKNENKSEDNGN